MWPRIAVDRRPRRRVRRPGHRHRRHGGRVRAVPEQPVRADAAAQPALQHRAVGRRRAAQAVRAARHASRRSPSGPARSTCPPTARSRSTTCRSATAPDAPVLHDVTSRSRRASGSRWSARPAPGSRRWPSSSRGFYDPRDGTRARSAASTCVTRRSRSLRQRIVVVPQEGFLFAGTIRDNIRVGRPDATDAEVEAASTRSALAERFAALPDGLDTEVRERGLALVGGRASAGVARARAALADPARARARRSDVEPRPGHRAHGRARARRLTEGRTVVVVAHRLSTAARADRIAVVDDGTLVELGTHDELIADEGRYASLYAAWDSCAATGPRVPSSTKSWIPRSLDVAEHDTPDEGAEAADEPPVARELATGVVVGAHDAGLGLDSGAAAGPPKRRSSTPPWRSPECRSRRTLRARCGGRRWTAARTSRRCRGPARDPVPRRARRSRTRRCLVEAELPLRLHRSREHGRYPAGEQQGEKHDGERARSSSLTAHAERRPALPTSTLWCSTTS